IYVPQLETSVVGALRAHPGKSLFAGFVVFISTPAAALLLVISVFGLPVGLVLGAVYAIGLFAAVLATAFCLGEVEAKLFRTGPMATRGQQLMLLLAGVLTLAVLRSFFGALVVFASVLFGLGALALAAYQ